MITTRTWVAIFSIFLLLLLLFATLPFFARKISTLQICWGSLRWCYDWTCLHVALSRKAKDSRTVSTHSMRNTNSSLLTSTSAHTNGSVCSHSTSLYLCLFLSTIRISNSHGRSESKRNSTWSELPRRVPDFCREWNGPKLTVNKEQVFGSPHFMITSG